LLAQSVIAADLGSGTPGSLSARARAVTFMVRLDAIATGRCDRAGADGKCIREPNRHRCAVRWLPFRSSRPAGDGGVCRTKTHLEATPGAGPPLRNAIGAAKLGNRLLQIGAEHRRWHSFWPERGRGHQCCHNRHSRTWGPILSGDRATARPGEVGGVSTPSLVWNPADVAPPGQKLRLRRCTMQQPATIFSNCRAANPCVGWVGLALRERCGKRQHLHAPLLADQG
jgi:hypothetical protein